MKSDFMLKNSLAEKLYAAVAELPIVDYHNHLPVGDLAANCGWFDLSALWLLNDPYKHRALRILGIEERMITGDASNYDKFLVWAKCLPQLVGNPLYHWSQLELARVFGIDEPLSEKNAVSVWNRTREQLSGEDFTAMSLLKRFNVEVCCPCVGLTDDLSGFDTLSGQSTCRIVPSMRGDDIMAITDSFPARLSALTGIEVVSLKSLRTAIAARLECFAERGCRFADHSLDSGFTYLPDDGMNEQRLGHWLKGEMCENGDRLALQSELLRILGEEYARLGWTVQLHIGAQRFTSSRLRRITGPTGGYASIGQGCNVAAIVSLLDTWEQSPTGMPDVILFTLNPADNAIMATLAGSFVQDGVSGKLQFGPAWWLNDHIYGIRQHLEIVAAYDMLSTFIGMTTDSRSLLSFVRHEYFRRILCNWLAEKVEHDEIPDEPELLCDLAVSLCHRNAASRFKPEI